MPKNQGTWPGDRVFAGLVPISKLRHTSPPPSPAPSSLLAHTLATAGAPFLPFLLVCPSF